MSRRLALVPILAAVTLASAPAAAQPVQVRLGLVAQWVVNQHGQTAESLGPALERGLVDGTVFSWQRGRIPRSPGCCATSASSTPSRGPRPPPDPPRLPGTSATA